ncbi:MAG TPA: hypothetical protein VHQ47_07810 [Phycisphaerae bacterium]|nr:hypothetical protein [Phycisphaerae bacterium]
MEEQGHGARMGGKDRAFLLLGAVFFAALGCSLALSVGIGVWPLDGAFIWRAVLALAVPGGLCVMAAREGRWRTRAMVGAAGLGAGVPLCVFFVGTAAVMYPWREEAASRAVLTARTPAEERAAYRAVWKSGVGEIMFFDSHGAEIRPWHGGDYSGVARVEFLWADGCKVAAPVRDGSDLEVFGRDDVAHFPVGILVLVCGVGGAMGLILIPGWLRRRRADEGQCFEVISRDTTR